jgi:hypothetical protein
MEIELDELFGLPAHPLLVHIPVVLIPTALLVLLVALWRPGRRPAVIAGAVLAVVGGIGAVLAVGAGEKLEHRVKETEQVEEHAENGDQVELPAIAFALLAAGTAITLEAAHRRTQQRPDANGFASPGAAPVGEGGGPGGPAHAGPGAVATQVRPPPEHLAAASAGRQPVPRWLPSGLLAVTLLVGAYATYTVVEAGHSGAKATWHDTPSARPGGDGDDDGD